MSVTTVPIQPIKKGSLTKYWLAVGLVLAIASGLAWIGTTNIREKFGNIEVTASGLKFQTLQEGKGASPTDNDVTLVGYKGTLRDGKVFDENPQAPMPVQGVVPGFSEALKKMQRGGKYKIRIPAALGYGVEDKRDEKGQIVLPGGSELIFEVELKDFISREKFEQGMAEMQKQQAAQGRQAAPGAAPTGAPGAAPQGLPPEIQAQLDAQLGKPAPR
jgi:FKBP-type peptidyl-prolyl cis-trans isomerase FkpA